MPKRSGKINRREREIGARLKEFREAIRWSQADFAERLGLTRNQLAAIEYGSTPLRYETAWQVRRLFGVSVAWLWGEGMTRPQDVSEDAELPLPEDPGVPKKSLLTEVFKSFYKLEDDTPSAPSAKEKAIRKVRLPELDVKHRTFLLLVVTNELHNWLARVPEGYTVDFCDKLSALAKSYLEALPAEVDSVWQARYDALVWAEVQSRAAKQAAAWGTDQKKELTDAATSSKTFPVKTQLPGLLERLKKATATPGKKTELAGFLKAPLASVSRWLAGEREPGGEVALQLLRWVEQQERKK